MSTTLAPEKIKQARIAIISLSIAIPLIVAVLFKVQLTGYDFSFLPPIYATINGLTAFFLLAALYAIKSHNMSLHRKLIRICLFLSLLFLAGYVAYHMTSKPTVFGDSNHDNVRDADESIAVGSMVGLYYFLLVSHVLLSIIVVPLVLFTYLFAWQGEYAKHKKLTRISFPIWLYVAISGVIVYALISPYYG
jgi:putative membrane protein